MRFTQYVVVKVKKKKRKLNMFYVCTRDNTVGRVKVNSFCSRDHVPRVSYFEGAKKADTGDEIGHHYVLDRVISRISFFVITG